MTAQGELDFSGSSNPKGLEQWREARRKAQRELARRLGLPLGYPVEVWLNNGIRLRGELRLSEELLFATGEDAHKLNLRVDATTFSVGEIESCVRLA